jgi:hypothetical protein
MRQHVVLYSDKTVRLSFEEANSYIKLSIMDQSRDMGSVQILFIPKDGEFDLTRNSLRVAADAFNVAMETLTRALTEEEKELDLEMNY